MYPTPVQARSLGVQIDAAFALRLPTIASGEYKGQLAPLVFK